MRYNVILSKAHSRTFNLMRRIQEVKNITYGNEMDEVLNVDSSQPSLFDGHVDYT